VLLVVGTEGVKIEIIINYFCRQPVGDWGRLEVLTEQLEPEPGHLIRLVQLTAFRNLTGFLFTPR